MRIVCISTSLVPDRTANSLQLMKSCEALAANGHELQLILPAFGPTLAWPAVAGHYGLTTEFAIRRLPVIRALRRYDFALLSLLAARSWRPDLYYVWPLQVAGAASLLGRPTVLELHDQPQGRLGPAWFRWFLLGAGARRIVITTQALQTHLQAQFDPARLVELALVAPNGVDIDRYRHLPAPAEARRQLGLPESFTAVYTGHLYHGRGAELMFALAQSRPDLSIVWAGGTEPAVAEWRQRVEQSRLSNLHVLGHIAHARVPLVQAAGDLLLMPYEDRIEVSGGGDSADFASPMKAIEYLAAGRPILASDLPVLHEVLDEDCARLLPPTDLERWRSAIDELRQNPERRRELAAEAQSRAGQYAWTRRAQRAVEGLAPAAAV